MKKLVSAFLLLSCLALSSCTAEEAPPPAAGAPSTGYGNPNIPPGSVGPAQSIVRRDNFEEGPALPVDESLPEKFRTPEACLKTGLESITAGDVKTWGECHHEKAAMVIKLCIEFQRRRLNLEPSEPAESVLAKSFKDMAGEGGKGMAAATVGKTRFSKDGSAARLDVNYDIPGGKFEYRFLKTDEGWKIEGPCLIPPGKQ